MHYSNMKAAENGCLASCNLLSQRHFNGNLSHFFFYKFTSIYVTKWLQHLSYSLFPYHFFGALTFLLITFFPLGLNYISSPYQRQHNYKKMLYAWDLKLWLSPWNLRFFHSLTTRVSRSNAFQLIEAFGLGGSRPPVMSLCFSSTLRQPFQWCVGCYIQILHSLYIQPFIPDEWLPRGLFLLTFFNCWKLTKKIMQKYLLDHLRFCAVSSGEP